MRRLVLLLVFIGLVVLGNAFVVGDLRVPRAWNPVAPLAVADPITPVTRLKLLRLDHDAAACKAALASSALQWSTVEDRETAPRCGWSDAVRLTGGRPALSRPAISTCRLAVSLALWQRHGLAQAAKTTLGSPVARLDHWGTYNCRTIAGSRRQSEHATANAIDIAAFVLRDGRRVSVLHDWADDSPEARFLHAARTSACRFFDVVLSPDYNAAHADHLHLDMGPFQSCH